ncbi:unnamed protein product [Phytophthora lilii]|uniref:Unnamed protein product n=1 Tax=Phytophthora lilii TaxID=2077276 RepID=A0A9W6U1B8_9STRA|nr:unnamed protein product [Phytophthora lilii]
MLKLYTRVLTSSIVTKMFSPLPGDHQVSWKSTACLKSRADRALLQAIGANAAGRCRRGRCNVAAHAIALGWPQQKCSLCVLAASEPRPALRRALPRGVRQRNRAFNVVKPRRKIDFSASAGPPAAKTPSQSQPRIDFAASAGPVRIRDDDCDETVTRQSLQALDNLLENSKGPSEKPTADRWEDLTASEDEPSYPLTPKQAPMTLEDLAEPESDDNSDGVWERTGVTPQAKVENSSMPLWQRMSALQVMAESTYRYTKKTTEKALSLSHGCSPSYASPPVVP